VRPSTSGPDTANLVFYENRLLVESTVWDRRVFLTLDTGAETTDLNASFARQFASPECNAWARRTRRA
jgi:hypothetical protein